MKNLVKRAWTEFRGTHIAVQVVCWVMWAVLLVGVIGSATGAGNPKRASAAVTSTSTSTSTSSSSIAPTTEHQSPVTVVGQPDVRHPSATLTPGATFPGVTAEQVCVSGYSASVRDVSGSLRDQVFSAYGLSDADHSQYEVDHLISLELGGSNDLANLWPEPLDGANGAKSKDSVENRLHELVCAGQVALTDAQLAIVHWDTVDTTTLASTTTTTVPPVTVPPVTVPPPPPVVTAPPATASPTPAPPAPPVTEAPVSPGNGATALCNDGTYSYAAHHQGACSHHGGVAVFYK